MVNEPTEKEDASLPFNGFRITAGEEGVLLEAGDRNGFIYGRDCWKHMMAERSGLVSEAFLLEDWPEVRVRGFMLDISRSRVPSMDYLRQLTDDLAAMRYNQLQLYTEHTFAYKGHEQVWQNASPLTGAEIEELVAYAGERGIEVVPNQNSFGHFERWLKYPEYHYLAESPDGFEHPVVGKRAFGSVLFPGDDAEQLLNGLYDQLLPHFSSGLFNVGCDETWELGEGRSREVAQKIGKTELYLSFLERIGALVRHRGKRMQFWADVLLEEPASLSRLSVEDIPIIWGYEAGHPWDKQMEAVAASGVREWMAAPGTSSWNTLLGRWENMWHNIHESVDALLRHGGTGILLTNWGDCGHYQVPLWMNGALVANAYACWHLPSSERVVWSRAMDRWSGIQGFGDWMAKVGRLETSLGPALINSACLGKLATARTDAEIRTFSERLTAEEIEEGSRLIRERLQETECWPDSPLRDDARLALDMAAWALEQARLRKRIAFEGELADRYRRSWLRDNRPGGLEESCNWLNGDWWI